MRIALLFVLLAGLLVPRNAAAQACCAGSGAVTPGRLGIHDDALVGAQLRAAHVFGTFDANGSYGAMRGGASEQDFEQDLIGSVRIPLVERLQLAVLLPLVETRRTATGASDFGGGIGDVNLSARYDFFLAGQSRFIPGIAALAGVTFPTGRPPESASPPLAADATGIGAFQFNAGVAVEQSFGPWLVTLYGIAAKRTTRTIGGSESSLGTQWTALAALAYTFAGDYALALSASYTLEGNAEINGATVAHTSRRTPLIGLAGVLPLSDRFRLQGGPSFHPPIDQLGRNQVATIGLTLTAVYTWY